MNDKNSCMVTYLQMLHPNLFDLLVQFCFAHYLTYNRTSINRKKINETEMNCLLNKTSSIFMDSRSGFVF